MKFLHAIFVEYLSSPFIHRCPDVGPRTSGPYCSCISTPVKVTNGWTIKVQRLGLPLNNIDNRHDQQQD